jgi:hypothetical protein
VVLNISPDADAQVNQANPTTNFGNSNDLGVVFGATNAQESYLKFTVTGVNGTIQSAVLKLNASNGSNNGPAVYTSNITNWTETGITWNTRPARTTVGTDDKGAINNTVDYNVTSLVGGNGTYTFVLATDSTDNAIFDSRNSNPASRRPVLIITVGSGGQPTATPAPTQSAQQQKIIAPTDTPTNTPVPPTATSTPTKTPVPPTNTPVPPTATNTPVPPTDTPTNTPVPPTDTPTPIPPTDTPVPPPPTETPSG